jgi:glycerate kinase
VAGSPLVPRAPLVAAGEFGPRLSALRVAEAIARGLRAGGAPAPDLCPLSSEQVGLGGLPTLLAEVHLDARLHAARAVIVAERRLDESTLAGSAAFEVATRARQAGVPAYAVTAHNRLDAFDARMLDLQRVLIGSTARTLAAAGAELARLL